MEKLLQRFSEFKKWENQHLKYLTMKNLNEESNEESDESDAQFTLDNTAEFCFDSNDIMHPNDHNCIKCGNTVRNKCGLAICGYCMRDLTINKTSAMKTYHLKASDLENINSSSQKNMYGGITYLYLLKEIRLLAIEKEFGLTNPSYEEYHNCVIALLENAEQRSIKSQERGEKIKATRKKNLKLKLEKEELEYEKRKILLSKALSKKGIDIDSDCAAVLEYLQGLRTDLKGVVKLASEYSRRKSKLESALAKKNLAIRDDSYYCRKYLAGKKFTLEEVVDSMEIMDFFANKTDYFRLCKQALQTQYNDAKEYGYWDGQRIDLCEEEKEKIKKQALGKYLEDNSAKGVPKVVLNRYYGAGKKIPYREDILSAKNWIRV